MAINGATEPNDYKARELRALEICRMFDAWFDGLTNEEQKIFDDLPRPAQLLIVRAIIQKNSGVVVLGNNTGVVNS